LPKPIARPPPLHLAHEEDPHADQQQHREPRHQDAEQRRHVLVDRRCGDQDARVDQPADEARVGGRVRGEGTAIGEMAGDRVALDRDVGDLAAIDVGHEIGKCQSRLRAAGRGGLKEIEQRDKQQADDDPQGQIFAEIIHRQGLSLPPRGMRPDRPQHRASRQQNIGCAAN
jgi:hypothetical protein